MKHELFWSDLFVSDMDTAESCWPTMQENAEHSAESAAADSVQKLERKSADKKYDDWSPCSRRSEEEMPQKTCGSWCQITGVGNKNSHLHVQVHDKEAGTAAAAQAIAGTTISTRRGLADMQSQNDWRLRISATRPTLRRSKRETNFGIMVDDKRKVHDARVSFLLKTYRTQLRFFFFFFLKSSCSQAD